MFVLSNEIKARISEKEIIVLSDRYPPKSFGGAEVSLHNALSSGDRGFRSKTLVVFFDAEIKEPALYSIAQITVLSLPDAAGWPFNTLQKSVHSRYLKNVSYRHFLKYILPAKDALKPRHFFSRLGAYYLELGPKPRGGAVTDFLLDSRDHRVRSLKLILEATKCFKLVADNTRSILIGALAGGNVPYKIAIVRDNRFNCARYNQMMMVEDAYCGSCNFACAQSDSKGRKLVESIHREHLEKVQKFRAESLGSYNTVIVTSHFLARNIRRVLGAGAEIRRVPNPAGAFDEVMSFCRGVAESARKDILIVGMLNEAKGQLELVGQAITWLKANQDVRFIFAGRGDRIKKAIQDVAKKNGIEKQIHFANYVGRSEIFSLLRSCKFVLLPTRWKEPFGRVPLEAGLARRPVVSFAVGGICETVVDGRTGLLVEPGNYSRLLEECDRLLADGELRHHLGQNAFQHVLENYSDENTSAGLIEVISGNVEKKDVNARPNADWGTGYVPLEGKEVALGGGRFS